MPPIATKHDSGPETQRSANSYVADGKLSPSRACPLAKLDLSLSPNGCGMLSSHQVRSRKRCDR